MSKELLNYLFENKTHIFKEELISFFNDTASCDLAKYSFIPSLLDSWLISSQERLSFKLYKLFQPGQLVYDVATYVLIPNKGNEAFIVTLTNINHDESDSQDEIMENLELRKDRQILVQERQRKKSVISIVKDSIFKQYLQLLDKNFFGGNSERAAKAAWLLAQDRTHESIDRLTRSKSIRYVGIANLKGVLNVYTGTPFHKILRQLDQYKTVPNFINEIKEALQVKDDMFAHRSLQTVMMDSDSSMNQPVDEQQVDSIFNENFRKELKFILKQHRETSGYNIFNGATLHGAVLGYLLTRRNKLEIELKSKAVLQRIRRRLLIIRPKHLSIAKLVNFQIKESRTLTQEAQEKIEKINKNQYRYIVEDSNLLRVEQISIVTSKFTNDVMVTKKIETMALPEKNRRSLPKLLVQGSFDAFKHNLNTMLKYMRPLENRIEFLPNFFLGLFLEGAAQGHLELYVQVITYQKYGFLIRSVQGNRLILLTNAQDNSAIVAMLSKYDRQLDWIAMHRKSLDIDILQVSVLDGEIVIAASKKIFESPPRFKSNMAWRFKKYSLTERTPFITLLENLLYKANLAKYAGELNQHIKQYLLEDWEKIFPNQPLGELSVIGGVIGFVTASWDNLQILDVKTNIGRFQKFYLCITPSLCVTPESEAISFSRNPLQKISPRSIAFTFRWNENLEGASLKNLAKENTLQSVMVDKLRILKKYMLDNTEDVSVVIASSATDVATHVTLRKKEEVSDISSITDATEEDARQDETDKIKKSMNELISRPDYHEQYESAKQSLNQALREKGIDETILNSFKKKVEEDYLSFGNDFLASQYHYLTGDPQKDFLYQHKLNINKKLQQWFSFRAYYDIFDSLVCIAQASELIPLPHVLCGADIFETAGFFLGERLSSHITTRNFGLFIKEISSNYVIKSLSYFGSLWQFSYNAYNWIDNGQSDFATVYWTLRGLHQSMALFERFFVFFRAVARTHFPFFVIDVIVSIAAHQAASRAVIYDFARFITLSQSERSGIGVKYFFGMDLSFYEQQIGFKQQFDLIHDYLKQVLNQAQYRAVVLYVDKLVRSQLYRQDCSDYYNGFIIPLPKGFQLVNTSYHVELGNTRTDAIKNLAIFSTEQFLPTHQAYLGLTSDTHDCLAYLSHFCKHDTGLADHTHIYASYHAHYIEDYLLKLPCMLINGASPSNGVCERHQQVLDDLKKRTIKVLDGADGSLPTQPLTDDRFGWVSAPLGTLQLSNNQCVIMGTCKPGLGQRIKNCEKKFVFNSSTPFILADKQKPVNASILYLNAPSLTIEGVVTTHLQVLPNNPAVMYVTGEYVAYQGSSVGNLFILQNSARLSGYLLGGKEKNNLVIGAFRGELSLKFEDDALALFNNQTLHAIQIDNYIGHANVTETIEINSCVLRTIDAKGGLQNGRDTFKVNDALRCKESDIEQRVIYAGDIHYLASHKTGLFRLNASSTSKAAFLIQPKVPCVYPQIVSLDVPSNRVAISSLIVAEKMLPGPAYEIKIDQVNSILKANIYKNLVYLTQDGVELSIKNRALAELKQISVAYELAKKFTTPSRAKLFDKNRFEDPNIVAFYNNNDKNHTRIFLKALMSEVVDRFYWQLQQFTIDSRNFSIYDGISGAILEVGSIYDNQFITGLATLTYEFTGGEGSDVYQILHSKQASAFPERVLINNKAFLHNARYGQDILDLSSFEYLDPKLRLTEIDDWEKIHFGLTNTSIVMFIEYDNLANQKFNHIRICLEGYRISTNYQHLFVKLSRFYGSKVLYRIDVGSKQLIPCRIDRQTLISASIPAGCEYTGFSAIQLTEDAPIVEFIATLKAGARHNHQNYYEIGRPKSRATGLPYHPRENSYFSNCLLTIGFLTGTILATGLTYKIFYLRTLPSGIYTPVTTSRTAAVVTTAAATMLIDSVEAKEKFSLNATHKLFNYTQLYTQLTANVSPMTSIIKGLGAGYFYNRQWVLDRIKEDNLFLSLLLDNQWNLVKRRYQCLKHAQQEKTGIQEKVNSQSRMLNQWLFNLYNVFNQGYPYQLQLPSLGASLFHEFARRIRNCKQISLRARLSLSSGLDMKSFCLARLHQSENIPLAAEIPLLLINSASTYKNPAPVRLFTENTLDFVIKNRCIKSELPYASILICISGNRVLYTLKNNQHEYDIFDIYSMSQNDSDTINFNLTYESRESWKLNVTASDTYSLDQIYPLLPPRFLEKLRKKQNSRQAWSAFKQQIAIIGCHYIGDMLILHTSLGDFFQKVGLSPDWSRNEHSHFLNRWLIVGQQLSFSVAPTQKILTLTAGTLETLLLYAPVRSLYKHLTGCNLTEASQIFHFIGDILQFGSCNTVYLLSLLEWYCPNNEAILAMGAGLRMGLSFFSMEGELCYWHLGFTLFVLPQVPYLLEHLGIPVTRSLYEVINKLQQIFIYYSLWINISKDEGRIEAHERELNGADIRVEKGRARLALWAGSGLSFFKAAHPRTISVLDNYPRQVRG